MPVRAGFLFKNQRQNRAPPNISFPPLSEIDNNLELCPVEALNIYLKRPNAVDKNPSLFTNPATHKNLQTSSISLWLCRIIEEFCPNSLPKAHDVRKQAASLAWVKGVPPEQIVSSAFWSSSNVFIENYLNSQISTSTPCVALRRNV